MVLILFIKLIPAHFPTVTHCSPSEMPVAAVAGGGRAVPVGDGGRGGRGGHRRRTVRRAAARAQHRAVALKNEKA